MVVVRLLRVATERGREGAADVEAEAEAVAPTEARVLLDPEAADDILNATKLWKLRGFTLPP